MPLVGNLGDAYSCLNIFSFNSTLRAARPIIPMVSSLNPYGNQFICVKREIPPFNFIGHYAIASLFITTLILSACIFHVILLDIASKPNILKENVNSVLNALAIPFNPLYTDPTLDIVSNLVINEELSPKCITCDTPNLSQTSELSQFYENSINSVEGELHDIHGHSPPVLDISTPDVSEYSSSECVLENEDTKNHVSAFPEINCSIQKYTSELFLREKDVLKEIRAM